MKGLIGKKLGMTQVFEENGNRVSVTALQVGPCTVTCLRNQENDGYSALQLAFGKRSPKKVSKAVKGHLRTAGLEDKPPGTIKEVRLLEDSDRTVGETLTAELFEEGEHVDVSGKTKGRGFQGVVKRYNFGGGRATHGGSWMRKTGSIGMCVNPGKIYKGRKMPGQTGAVNKTSQNLRVVSVRPEDNVILVKGAVPGPNGGMVMVRETVKNKNQSA